MMSGPVRVTVPRDAEGSRLDHFLRDRLGGRTRSALGRLIREGCVRIDGRPAAKPGLALRGGMNIVVDIPAVTSDVPQPEDIPLALVYEDPHLLLVNKPAGLVVHPGHGRRTGTLVNALLGRGVTLAPAGGVERPGIVHRLDRETSGLLVVAKSDEAYRALTRRFALRQVRKTYRALVWGHPDPEHGVIERAIGRSRNDRTKMSVRGPRGRHAVTHYRTLETLPGFSLLQVKIATGRTHQIRVHMQSIRHPVVGDARYGGRPWRGVQDPVKRKALREFDRLALHAERLEFDHPLDGRPLEFSAPLPGEFVELLSVLRKPR